MTKKIVFKESEYIYLADTPSDLENLLKKGEFAVPVLASADELGSFPHTDYVITEASLNDPDTLDMDYLYRIYKRLAGKPWEILRTKRTIIREMTVEDVDAFYEIYSMPGITDYMDPLFEDPEDEREYTRNYIKNIYGFYGYGLWTVLDKNTGRVIGRAGVSNIEGCDYPDLGFVIRQEYQNKGYAFEVCSAIISLCQNELKFDKIGARVRPSNEASIRLLSKLGFTISHTPHQGYLEALRTLS